MNTKLATSRMCTGQEDDSIKECKERNQKVDDYCAQYGLSRNSYFYWLRREVKKSLIRREEFRSSLWKFGSNRKFPCYHLLS